MESRKKWALITGAHGGIGQALVCEFLAEGYFVIATDLTYHSSKFISESVYELKLDLADIVSNPKIIARLNSDISSITEDVGINVLINNAAVQILANTEELTIDQWKLTWDVNLHAPFLLIQNFLASLIRNNGAIVNISSIHAIQTKKKFVAYATSKAALSSLTRNLAVDIGGKVRVNAIEAAAVGTEMLLAGFEGKKREFDKLGQFHPLGRIASPKEISELAVFLCSNKSHFVQGACISATGGIHGCLSDPDVLD